MKKLPWNSNTRRALFSAVTDQTGVSRSEMVGRRRTELIAGARQLAWFVVRTHFEDVSLIAIGEPFGHRDHGTILHGVRRISERLEHDTSLRVRYCCVCELLGVDPIDLPTIDRSVIRLPQSPPMASVAPVARSLYQPDPPVHTIPGRWRSREVVTFSDIKAAALEAVEPYRIASW